MTHTAHGQASHIQWLLSPWDHLVHAFPEDQIGDVIAEALCTHSVRTSQLSDEDGRKCLACLMLHGDDLANRQAVNRGQLTTDEGAQSFDHVEGMKKMLSIEEFLRQRPDWECLGGGEDSTVFRYTASFNGANINPARCPFYDVGLESLDVELLPRNLARVYPCRVANGCPEHAAEPITVQRIVDASFRSNLEVYEYRARTINLDKLSRCVLFGSCSTREFVPFSDEGGQRE